MSMEKIENMNLADLKDYACPKVSSYQDWYMRCLSCNGIEDCRTGKRVRDILDDQTKPETQTDKFNERMGKTVDMRIEEALKQDDPAGWLVEHGYYSNKESAKAQIRKYKNRKHSEIISKKAADLRIAKTRERICTIFENCSDDHEKMMAYLRNSDPGSKLSSLYGNLKNWANHFPDLEERFHFIEPCRILNREPHRKLTAEQYLKSAESKDLVANTDEDEDEISIEDFLTEVDGPVVAEPVLRAPEEKKEPEITVVERVSPRYPVGQNPFRTTVPTQQILQTEFGRKKQELRKRINYIQEQITKLSEQKKEFEHQMEMLDKTATLFGMRPTA